MNFLPDREATHRELVRILPALFRALIKALPTEVAGLARVTPEQFSVLSQLASSGTLSMTELAASRRVALNTATSLVDRLALAGLVQRQGDPSDRRVVRVAVTEKGQRLVSELATARRRVIREMLDRLSDAEVAQVQAALPALAQLAGLREEALT